MNSFRLTDYEHSIFYCADCGLDRPLTMRSQYEPDVCTACTHEDELDYRDIQHTHEYPSATRTPAQSYGMPAQSYGMPRRYS